LPAYIGEYFIYAVLGIILAIGLSFAMSWFLVPNQVAEGDRYTNEVDLHAVTHGEYVPLEDVPDEVFSTKMMGEGYAIESQDGQIFAPVSGEVTTVFPSKHAVGIKTQNGGTSLLKQ